jgi:AGZA family xanthine/uracil permease-like MFS transporter
MLERCFGVRAAGSTLRRELLGGLTTFLTMAYIIVVNPAILGEAGVPHGRVFLATCCGAALGTLLMAFLANYPIALAPGMGLNAFFTYGICIGSNVAWPTALGIVFWSSVLFLAITASGMREAVARAVPAVIKLAAGAGIGLFIAFIGLQQGGLVVKHDATLVTLGDVTALPAVLTVAALGVTLVLLAAGVQTAVFWGVVVAAAGGLATGLLQWPAQIVSLEPVEASAWQFDLFGALRWQYVHLILVVLFFDMFDTLGTLMAIAHEGGFWRDGQMPRIERAMAADALGTLGGSLLGTSPVTAYIESATGVAVGARTGLASVVIGLLFLAALFFSPLAKMVAETTAGRFNPVTAPALIAVGILMVRVVRHIEWDQMSEAIPAFFTMLLMPLTFNISHGLAAGIVVYVVAKAAARRWAEVHWLMYVLAGLFVLRYAFLPL